MTALVIYAVSELANQISELTNKKQRSRQGTVATEKSPRSSRHREVATECTFWPFNFVTQATDPWFEPVSRGWGAGVHRAWPGTLPSSSVYNKWKNTNVPCIWRFTCMVVVNLYITVVCEKSHSRWFCWLMHKLSWRTESKWRWSSVILTHKIKKNNRAKWPLIKYFCTSLLSFLSSCHGLAQDRIWDLLLSRCYSGEEEVRTLGLEHHSK